MPAHTSPAAAQAAGHGGDGFRVAPTKVPPRLVSTDLPIGYISCSSLAAPLGLRAGIRVGTRPISGPSGRVDGQVLAVTRPAQPSPAQPSPAQPSPAQPSPAQRRGGVRQGGTYGSPSPAQPSGAARWGEAGWDSREPPMGFPSGDVRPPPLLGMWSQSAARPAANAGLPSCERCTVLRGYGCA